MIIFNTDLPDPEICKEYFCNHQNNERTEQNRLEILKNNKNDKLSHEEKYQEIQLTITLGKE